MFERPETLEEDKDFKIWLWNFLIKNIMW